MNIFNSLGSNYTFGFALRALLSRDGASARDELQTYLESRYGGTATLTYKGREALYLAASTLPEGAIAIQGYTCLAVYEAIIESGHAVHYLDTPENGLNFSPATLQSALEANPNIRGVVIQNTIGASCDIQTIKKLCGKYGVALIEDLAHSIGARYASGEEAGTVGDMAILSFSQDKVVDAVSGGALIVRNQKYETASIHFARVSVLQQLKDRIYPVLTWKIRTAYRMHVGKAVHGIARALRLLSSPFGKHSARFVRALPGWYCANILRQFQVLDNTARHRREVAATYARILDKHLLFSYDIPHSANLRFPIHTHDRDSLIRFLKARGVHISDIWYDAPIAPEKYMRRTEYKGQCPHAERISEMMLNLPTHVNVSMADAEAIANAVNEWHKNQSAKGLVVRSVNDETEWEKFMSDTRPHSFLHSWKWGEHNEDTGARVFRIGAYQNDTLIGVALLIKVAARRGAFLLCPHGPVTLTSRTRDVLPLILERAEDIAKRERCDFVRICPISPGAPENAATYRSLGFRDAPIHMHPELSWMLDITKSEDDLLREMRKTTRYLVKKMEKPVLTTNIVQEGKEGVEISQSTNPDDIEKFWTVYEATVQRQHFTPFSKESLRKEFELFAKDNQAAFFFGTYQGEIVAAAIIIFYNGQAFYHHSGSIHKTKDINASYLLQWRVIQEAKRRGCTLYNFWGISPENRPNHPWAGLSLFKKGFGGFAEEYLHAQDKPLTKKYWLNYAVESTRRIKRGL